MKLTSSSLCITNSGEGMSKEQIAKIFDRYTRFNANQGGFGIGLSVVKECCKNNDINIQCQSSPNSDTTFMLSWK
ncbi:sensor histidine kinase [Campylobacter suis]|nr:ATP-binding protein [Campylobacter suis]